MINVADILTWEPKTKIGIFVKQLFANYGGWLKNDSFIKEKLASYEVADDASLIGFSIIVFQNFCLEAPGSEKPARKFQPPPDILLDFVDWLSKGEGSKPLKEAFRETLSVDEGELISCQKRDSLISNISALDSDVSESAASEPSISRRNSNAALAETKCSWWRCCLPSQSRIAKSSGAPTIQAVSGPSAPRI